MKWTVILGILFGTFVVMIGQQMQSGGSAVTVTSGTVTANAGNGPATAWKVDLSQTGANSTAIKVDPSGVTSPVSLASLPALAAGTAKIGIAYPYSSCGTTAFTEALQAMPSSSTAITTTTTCVLQLALSNTSGGALTVTVSDDQGTPVNFLNAVTLNAGETRNYPALGKFTSGIKIQASGTGVTYSLEGVQ